MNSREILSIIESQKTYFKDGNTFDLKRRKDNLKKLYAKIKENIELIYEGLYKDLGKSKTESYMCEIGLVLSEITYILKHMNKYLKPRRVKTPLAQFKSKSYELSYPYGNVLIMSPWNYPFLLSMEPLCEAIACGNTVILKTSEYSVNTNVAIKKIVEEVFNSNEAYVIFGGLEENQTLMNAKFDYVFFTGSKRVGNALYEAQSKYMTPMTLELGGKSPCIIDKKVNLKLAAKRIVFGKLLNLGQTCVAPDYILCDDSICDDFIKHVKIEIEKQFSQNPLENINYGKIITKKHLERIINLIDYNKVIYGGKYDLDKLKLEPTIMDNVSFDDKIMSEEIFGPVMPIIRYNKNTDFLNYINEHDAPLAFYIFTNNKKMAEFYINNIGFGGGCINDVIIHLATSNMRFGGYKESGMGSYHGAMGFETFSHYKSIVNKSTHIDLPMRYAPYSKKNDKLIKMFLR